MKLFILAVVVVVCSAGLDRTRSPHMEEFQAWKTKHGKTYADLNEEVNRLRIWEENLKIVNKHNLEYSLGMHTFYLGMNIFADLTNDEFVATYLGKHTQAPANEVDFTDVSVPSTVDWRTKGYVTPVKDQGQCGSCWSFSATGALEGQYAKTYGVLDSFSEQQQVDCNKWCYGCDGGNSIYSFKYWQEKYGANLESAYPYTAKDGSCHTSQYKQIVKLRTYQTTKSGSESALMNAVGSVGPISIAIDASENAFQLYSGGLYYNSRCSSTNLDHAVLAVGYGTMTGGDYWLVKNSWGTSWGDEGYIYMSRNRNNNCGVATDCSYPVI